MSALRDNPPPLSPCPKCGIKETEKKDIYYEGSDPAEYSLHCVCGEYLGYFCYGSWEY